MQKSQCFRGSGFPKQPFFNSLLMNDTFVSYTYDTRNRLVQVGGTGSTPSMGYCYEPSGNRVAVTNLTNGQVTRFVVNPNARLSQVLMRIRPGVTNYYVYGLGSLSLWGQSVKFDNLVDSAIGNGQSLRRYCIKTLHVLQRCNLPCGQLCV